MGHSHAHFRKDCSTMPNDRPAVIVNPRSGGGLGHNWARFAGALTDGLGPFDVRFTEAPGDGRRLAQEEAAAGRKLIVAFGGDGTISEVADGVLSSGGDAELGIVPHGTGGDFRRCLGLPEDVREAGRRVRDGSVRCIDTGYATFALPAGSGGQSEACRHFINVASFGFSAHVALAANRSSKRFGAKAAFLGAAVRTLMATDNADVFISVDGKPEQRMRVLLGAAGNGRFFGGGMQICPGAQLDDGALDLVTAGDFGRIEVLRRMPHLYRGTHLKLDGIQTAHVRTVTIRPADPHADIPIELDGETPGRLPATFKVMPRALKLRV
jgi:YegS/Rv2252/BmrU family lipid kinase